MAVSPLPTTRAHGAEEDLPKMSFGDHLDELRRRLIRAVGAVVVCVLVLLPFKAEVTGFYTSPYRMTWARTFADYVRALEARVAASNPPFEIDVDQLAWVKQYGPSILDGTFPRHQMHNVPHLSGFAMQPSLVALGGIDDIWIFMAASLLIGLILAAPIVLYQLWAFIAAGLYEKERRVVLRYFPFATVLLITGVVFGFTVVVPWGLYFLVQMMDFFGVVPMFAVSQYFSLLLTLTAALGVIFQMPLAMLALQKVGITDFSAMRKHWRYVILGIFVVSAVVTPSPDPFTQLMMALPMCLLYVLGLVICWRSTKPKA